jgi:hypothetical protein
VISAVLYRTPFQYKFFGNVKFCGEYKNVSMKKVSSLFFQRNIQELLLFYYETLKIGSSVLAQENLHRIPCERFGFFRGVTMKSTDF